MTGQDDRGIIEKENKKSRDSRLDIEAETLETILSEKRAELAAGAWDAEALQEQAERLERSITEATEAVIVTREEIATLERQRADHFDERTAAASRSGFLREQIKRLQLLDMYYQTDRERLSTVVETSRAYHDLPEGACPLCSRKYVTGDVDGSPHESFELACIREIEKIDVLQADLRSALRDFTAEEQSLRELAATLDKEIRRLDQQLRDILSPQVQNSQSDLQNLIRKRTSVAQGETLRALVQNLEERLARTVNDRKSKPVKSGFENRATTSIAFEFCEVVEGLLREFKYPNLTKVSFDTTKGDLVIDGQDRGNLGKGYLALTHAAFTIGLMKYCRKKGIPHPGFVVLDSPLNPFKGPDAETQEGKVDKDVKAAFYSYLAKDDSGDQIIILENDPPPSDVAETVKHYHFTGNPAIERTGFFPPLVPVTV